MKISKYFNLKEFVRSGLAAKNHIDNTPSPAEVENLKWLARNVLDELRYYEGKPLYVLSGYRCRELNQKVPGAVYNSQHITGEAADVTFGDKYANQRAFDFLDDMEFDQAIEYDDYSFLHISFRRYSAKNRCQKLHKTTKNNTYEH